MRPPTLIAASASLILAVALMGCVPTEPEPTPTPSASAVAPVFANQEEALAAAEAAYGEYVRVSTEISVNGGANPEAIEEVATGELLEQELSSFDYQVAHGLRVEGEVSFTITYQSMTSGNGLTTVRAYVCSDVSMARLVDSSGIDLTRPDRAPKTNYLVEFWWVDGRLLPAQKEEFESASC